MLLDYDSVISIIVPDVGCIEKMRQDPDFLNKFIPDHFNFADMSRSRLVYTAIHFETNAYTEIFLKGVLLDGLSIITSNRIHEYRAVFTANGHDVLISMMK